MPDSIIFRFRFGAKANDLVSSVQNYVFYSAYLWRVVNTNNYARYWANMPSLFNLKSNKNSNPDLVGNWWFKAGEIIIFVLLLEILVIPIMEWGDLLSSVFGFSSLNCKNVLVKSSRIENGSWEKKSAQNLERNVGKQTRQLVSSSRKVYSK